MCQQFSKRACSFSISMQIFLGKDYFSQLSQNPSSGLWGVLKTDIIEPLLIYSLSVCDKLNKVLFSSLNHFQQQKNWKIAAFCSEVTVLFSHFVCCLFPHLDCFVAVSLHQPYHALLVQTLSLTRFQTGLSCWVLEQKPDATDVSKKCLAS